MMQGLSIICTWISLLILSELQCGVTNSCLHDVTTDNDFTKYKISSKEHLVKKVKRKIPRTNLSENKIPIRIQPVYFLSKHLLKQEKLALQTVLSRAITKIESLLSVINRVKGPLLLKRKAACPTVFINGINKGKCSRMQKGYVGEVCLDTFKIPSNHLEGFAIYNKTSPDPIKVYKSDGPGLKDTDFILYVTSKTTVLCNPYKSSALAYAAACQLDDFGRPVAGQVNFCPRTLKAQKFDEELLYKTAIHELFHALGFSRKLFEKFVSCEKDGKYNPRKLLRTVNGITRLVTSAVVKEMKQHFDCNAKDFGGPLQVVDGKVSSHWDPILMHSSIMTAREQKPYVTLIDRITLAVFEDSGWYKVDYSQADPFIWGKGKGCQFGIEKKCDKSDGFCSNTNSTGCHHLRLSKAKCNANPNLNPSGCGIFAADQKPCFMETGTATSKSEEESFSLSSRCFMSSLVPQTDSKGSQVVQAMPMRGKCYESKCEANKVYVRVKSGEWILCYPGSKIQVDNFDGFIECPPTLEICTSFYMSDIPITAPTTLSSYEINNTNSFGHSRPVRSNEKQENKFLYAKIKISADFNEDDAKRLSSALYGVLKNNRLLFNSNEQSQYPGKIQLCLTVEIRDGETFDRTVLKDLFYKAVSKTFLGQYDRKTSVSVLTSERYFCKSSRHGKKSWGYGGGAQRDRTPSSFLIIFLAIVRFLITKSIYTDTML